MNRLFQAWRRYRYRFVPWLIFNLKNRSLRTVDQQVGSKMLSQKEFEISLFDFLAALNNVQILNCPDICGSEVMQRSMGFTIQRSPSVLKDGGLGVKVISGMIPTGVATSLYPGLVYEPHDPVFFQSIGNPFIFKCVDGTLIDGNDKGLSKILYRSCRGRESCWPLPSCDDSWLTSQPFNPWNVGQYVNNHTKNFPANVSYEEFDLPEKFPARLRQYLPNIFFTPGHQVLIPRRLRVVALISLRDIHCGEELFSSYFTFVR